MHYCLAAKKFIYFCQIFIISYELIAYPNKIFASIIKTTKSNFSFHISARHRNAYQAAARQIPAL